MQLRVARLCLDCENLHVDDRCPVCGSDQYAFLSTWLPSEERRRWRRQPTTAPVPARPAQRLMRRIFRWMGVEATEVRTPGGPPRTRASDRVPDLNFDGQPSSPAPRPKPADDPLPQSHDR